MVQQLRFNNHSIYGAKDNSESDLFIQQINSEHLPSLNQFQRNTTYPHREKWYRAWGNLRKFTDPNAFFTRYELEISSKEARLIVQ
jgi:hypothetical protein